MTTLRTGGLGALLFLSVTAGALAGPKSDAPAAVPAPVVKIGDAWMQERVTLPDGTVRTQTYLNGTPVQKAAKSAAPATSPRKTAKA